VLFFGKTADLFGRKVQLLAGLASLSLFAFITSFAPNGIALNVLLGFLGLGTAAIAPPSVGILFTTYPPGRRRNKVIGALGCGNPLGFVLGSVSSGVATKYSSWRASFIVVSIFFFTMTVMAFWTVPVVPREGSIRLMIRQFDYLGTVLTVIGVAIFSAALTLVSSLASLYSLTMLKGRTSSGLESSKSHRNAGSRPNISLLLCDLGKYLHPSSP
jgi:MFS family permease